jgi:5-formyltetrahydrofolate cyclo-ligase
MTALNGDEKSALRNQMRKRRLQLSPHERKIASEELCRKLLEFFSLRAPTAKVIAVYLASAQEIDLTLFIREFLQRGMTLLAPRWNGYTYELSRLVSLEESDLRCGPMRILEPLEEDIFLPDSVDVWVVPGLAFTVTGERLGYGGGWYDRLLSNASEKSLKVALSYDFQIVSSLPTQEHDIPLDAVIF